MIKKLRSLGVICNNRSGFTLIEILIVIIVLGILAMIIIPQITVSTEDAKVSTLKSNLSGIRSALEIYYAQHDNKYPGQTTAAAGAVNNDAVVAAADMIKQLTQYTDINGQISGTKVAATFKFGPYIKGPTMPKNPFITDAANAVAVLCDVTADITTARVATVAGGQGWKYHFNTGVFYANDGGADHAGY